THAPLDEGREAIVPDSRRPTVVAAFTRESYRPGRVARLVFTDHVPAVTMQIYRAGTDSTPLRATDVKRGTAVTKPDEPGPVHRRTPPHLKINDLPFLQWVEASGKTVDYLADSDLASTRTGARLRAAYSLVVFPSHEEYVTTREYDVVTAYRNRGGHLIFLSANNFFWRIVSHGNVMTRTRRWRDLGRPEAALIGVEYFRNDRGQRREPWVIRASPANNWLLSGSGLAPGSRISSGGIEADRIPTSSPRNITILPPLPN